MWSQRATQRPARADEKQMRTQALRRLPNRCGARGDGRPESDGCGATGVFLFCDHIVAHHLGGPTHWRNAQLLCGPCHEPKTIREASAARARARAARPKQRPPKPHPGWITPN